jgi:hypothetical protein
MRSGTSARPTRSADHAEHAEEQNATTVGHLGVRARDDAVDYGERRSGEAGADHEDGDNCAQNVENASIRRSKEVIAGSRGASPVLKLADLNATVQSFGATRQPAVGQERRWQRC